MQYYIIFWLVTIVIVEAPLNRVTRMLNSRNQKQIPQPMNNKLFKNQTNKQTRGQDSSSTCKSKEMNSADHPASEVHSSPV